MAHIFLTVTCRKPTPYLFECLQSLFDQTHRDWSAHVAVDDVPAADLEIVKQLLEMVKPYPVAVQLVQERRYALANQLQAIDQYCQHSAIVGKLDGDDRLSDPEALAAVSAEYDEDPKLDVLWTKFSSNSNKPCCCGPLEPQHNPLTCGWRTSHFQTFRKSLLAGVERRAFIDPRTGRHWQCSCDQALYLPLLLLARRRKFLPRVCYFYRRGVGDNVSAEQKDTAVRIREHNQELQNVRGSHDVLFIVNGPGAGRDKRFYSGERRPPLGVLSMAAHLRARQHTVTLVDRFLDPKWLPSQATLDAATHVGFYISTPNAVDARDTLRWVKQRSGAVLLAGGPHSILWPEQVRKWGADSVYCGEADFAISSSVEGRAESYPSRLSDLDELPFPAYSLLREQGILDKYSHGWPFDKQAGVFTLNTSRGCPFCCAFCDVKTVWGRQYHAMSAKRVLLDVLELVTNYGAQAIYFREDNFCCDVKRVLEIAKHMPVPWACEVRADVGCREDVVAELAAGKCRGFYVGAESGSDRMLKLMSKGISADQIKATCRNARKHGIHVALSLIQGYPGEESEDRQLTSALIREAKAHRVWMATYRKPWGQHEQSPIGD